MAKDRAKQQQEPAPGKPLSPSVEAFLAEREAERDEAHEADMRELARERLAAEDWDDGEA